RQQCGAGLRTLQSNHGAAVGILRGGRPAEARGFALSEAARQRRRHRRGRVVFCLRPGRLDHRPDPQPRRPEGLMESLAYLRDNRERILGDLIEFASIPSVSTDPLYAESMARASAWVAERMRKAGLENVRINRTSGHSIVTSTWTGAAGAPTILI